MKNTISFVMLMLVLALPIAFAEDTANETTITDAEQTSDGTETQILTAEVTSAEVTAETTTTDEATPVLILAPAETTDNTTEVVVEGVADYTALDQAWDRLRLAFTFQQEKRAELISKITAKREAHYQFLVAKGKDKQADKFREGTTKLQATLQKSIDKKAARLNAEANKTERETAKIQKKINAADNISEVEDKARERVKSKVAEKDRERISNDSDENESAEVEEED